MTETRNQAASCPHCGKAVDPLRAPAVSVVSGKIAHFCSADCREQHLRPTRPSSEPAPTPQTEFSKTDGVSDQPSLPESETQTRNSDKTPIPESDPPASEPTEKPPENHSPHRLRRTFRPSLANQPASFPFLKGSLLNLAIRGILVIFAFFSPHFTQKMIPLMIVGAGALGLGIYAGVHHRRRGMAIVAEHVATPLASIIILLSTLGSTTADDAAVVAASLLLAEGLGRILEILGRSRSGVEQIIGGTTAGNISSSWRDNSPLAATLRRISLFLDWARFPLAAAVGVGVYFMYNQSLAEALVGAATALVVLGPRALRMSTGDAHLSAALRAAGRGITIRDAHVLDRLAKSRLVLFMSTRSLFKRKTSIVDWSLQNEEVGELALRALGALEHNGEGRIPQAIQDYVGSQGVQYVPASEVTFVKGKGLVGSTEVGTVICGNRMLLLENGISTALLEDRARIIEKSGRRALFLAVNETITAVFGLEETPLPGAEGLALALNELGFEPILMTSAEIEAAQSLGKRLGISNVRFQKREEELGELLSKLNQTGEQTILVGHGLHFEEHLGVASASYRVGGAETTQAGVDGRGVSIDSLPWLLGIAKAAKLSAEANLVLSASAMTVGLSLALGWFSPYTIVFAGVLTFGASALSTLNGPYLRLDAFRKKTNALTTSLRKRAQKKWAALR